MPRLLSLFLSGVLAAVAAAGPPPGPPLQGDFLHQLTRALAKYRRAHRVPEDSLKWLGERGGRSRIQVQEALWAVDEELRRLVRQGDPEAASWLPPGTLTVAAEQGHAGVRELVGWVAEVPEEERDPEAAYWLGLRFLGPKVQDLARARGLLQAAAEGGHRGAREKLDWLAQTRESPRILELASRPSISALEGVRAGCHLRVRLSRGAGSWQVETSLDGYSREEPGGRLLAHRVRTVPARAVRPVLRRLEATLAGPRGEDVPERVLRLSLTGRGVPLTRDLGLPAGEGCGPDAALARALGELAAHELVTCEGGEGCLPCRCTEPAAWGN